MKYLRRFILLLFFCCTAYIALWFYIQSQIQNIVSYHMNELEKQDYVFAPKNITITGFPTEHVVTYQGSILNHRTQEKLYIEDLELKSFFISGLPFHLNIKNIEIQQAYNFTNNFKFDEIILTGALPILPANNSRTSMQEWHDENRKINIESIYVRHNTVEINGSGELYLDSSLQPAAIMNFTIYDPSIFIDLLSDMNLLNEEIISPLRFVVKSLTKTDNATGQYFLTVPVNIRNQTVLLGPVPVAKAPKITWPDTTVD